MSLKLLLKFLSLSLLLCTCSKKGDLSPSQFEELMRNVAKGWSTQNTELALGSFDQNAIYMQPPDIQFYQGYEQLRPYFDELTELHQMEFHHLWFDEKTQTGAGEFTFSYGEEIADTGIAIVELKDGKIVHWREYIVKGPTDFRKFLSTEGKDWEWHIGNYPAPKE